ncbi:hypothetical protein C7999DRAFT_11831 [Corynascus novoguineensis]|uniref:Uncharacterized protein n=1 Tax=Corynascus novoguineensis TaxID=1126955 RepID=A0AAN7CXV7_9PEZI|nr:hypothetical protein C7999DRAFT_11831 [Corynascus novoguineensis]
MSPLPVRKAARPVDMTDRTDSQTIASKREFHLSSQAAAFDEPIFDRFDDMDSPDTVMPSPKPVFANDEVPQLPPKSALRASRMLENLGLKLGGAVEAADLGQATTPHDVYLSSEEDASSDADDFSDYDYDSSVEDPSSPTRISHEDTARVVSVVFSGKPSIVDLPAVRRRPISSISLGTTRTRSSTESSSAAKSHITTAWSAAEARPTSPASTASSRHSRLSKDGSSLNRRSTLLSEVLVKKKPPFLNIDPYANGSGYALNIPKALDSLEGETQSAKTPRTPTTLLKGVTRSFSLSRRRSRPNMSSPPTAVPTLDTSLASSSNPKRHSSILSPTTEMRVGEQQQQEQEQQPKTPMTPITYTDILRAVKRNATVMGAPSPPSDILSPTEQGPATARRGILSGLSVRRRSVKLMGKP